MPSGQSETRVTDAKTGGQKGVKWERYDLMPWDALDAVARVYGKGARKYEDRNWEKGYKWGLSLGAMVRHIAKFATGEWLDQCEAGCPSDCVKHTNEPHLACAAWHCLALIAFHDRGKGENDIYQPSAAKEYKEAQLIEVRRVDEWTPPNGDGFGN